MNGIIPVLTVQAKSLAETWEKSIIELWNKGCNVRTEYDDKDKDGKWLYPPSRDCTMVMTILDPASEPAIHRAFPGTLEDLEEYRQEVVDGIKDHWVRKDVGEGTEWEYTYHERLTKYSVLVAGKDHRGVVGADREQFDQLQSMVDKLARTPYSRRCNAVTWQPWKDNDCVDPPCLQSIWCRILPDDNGLWHLNMNVRFRSRDAYDAAFMNMWAFVDLQRSLAERISDKAGRPVAMGHYCDISDSYHIYGKRLDDMENRFMKLLGERSFENRTWTREFAQPIFDETKPKIIEKIRMKDDG